MNRSYNLLTDHSHSITSLRPASFFLLYMADYTKIIIEANKSKYQNSKKIGFVSYKLGEVGFNLGQFLSNVVMNPKKDFFLKKSRPNHKLLLLQFLLFLLFWFFS
jgi:hypothetical protein